MKHNNCIVCNLSRSYYNYKNENTPTHCRNCSLSGMINVTSKLCIMCKEKRPNFNFPNQTAATHCGSCKESTMVDVRSKKCITCGLKQATFNNASEKSAAYCADCKSAGMKNFKGYNCIKCDKKEAAYNFAGEKKRLFCIDCKDATMISLKGKTCSNSWCYTQVCTTKFDGFCMRCFVYMYPEHELSKNYKAKELQVVQFIKDKYSKEYVLTFDQKINGGCSRRRPDVFLDMFTHIVIIEVDEEQHAYYDNTCEFARINELFTDVGDRPIVFIRFNPDKYKSANGKFVKSPFKYDKKLEIPTISNKLDWDNRLDMLASRFEHHINNIPSQLITNDLLFYDEL